MILEEQRQDTLAMSDRYQNVPLDNIPLQKFGTPSTQDPSLSGYNPALAASTQIQNKLFVAIHSYQQKDELEQDIWPLAKSHASARKYLQDYSLIKNQPGSKILQNLLRISVYEGAAIPRTLHDGGLVVPVSSTHINFSGCLKTLKEILRSPEVGSLRLCVLFFGLPNNVWSKLFSFNAQSFTTRERLQLKCDAAAKSVLYIIRKEWDPDRQWLQKPFGEPWGSKTRVLPSKAKTHKPFSAISPKQLTLTWISTAPAYHSNFYEYIWQRQNTAPAFERATITSNFNSGSRNTVLIFSSTAPFDETKGQRARLPQKFQEIIQTDLEGTAELELPLSVETTFVLVVLRLFIFVVGEIENFLKDSTHIVHELNYHGRQRPSNSKLNYLSHLEDCRCITENSLAAALEILSEISGDVKGNPFVDQAILKISDSIASDFVFLHKEIKALKEEMKELNGMLKNKIDLRQISRTYVLTFLATIYLPFSFMASLYGMNLDPVLWNQPKHSNSSSNPSSTPTAAPSVSAVSNLQARQATTNLSLMSQNQTDALITAIKSSGTYQWTFKSYWYLTVPITVATILIPIFVGQIIRIITQFSYRRPEIWRFTVLFFILICMIMIDFFVLGESLIYGRYYLIFGLGYCVPGLLLVLRSLYKKTHRITWTVFLVLSVVVTFVPVNNPAVLIILTYLPFWYIFFFWFRSEVKAYLTPRLGIFERISWMRRGRRSSSDPSSVEEGNTRSGPSDLHSARYGALGSTSYTTLDTTADILGQFEVPRRR